jgi:ABC-type uncharacterized transport system fused permease/ATPase subunit
VLSRVFLNQTLQLRWRRWLTDQFLTHWLADRIFYRLRFSGKTDNPDQRISEDARIFTELEQWSSILQRKRLRIADFKSLEDLRQKLVAFVEQWNLKAHPFKWTSKSVAKIIAYAEPLKAAA